jgi:chromate transporter
MPAIRREVVRNAKWLDDDQYLEMLSVAQLLPGSNPTSIAVLVGAQLRGIPGAAVALLAAVLPGFAILMVIGVLALDSHTSWTTGALRACAAVAVGLTLANAVELTMKRIKVADVLIMAGVAASVLLLHISLFLTLIIFTPIALFFIKPKPKKVDA